MAVLIACGFFLFAAPLQWMPNKADWDKAGMNIRRLPPKVFTRLPRAIREELDRRQCTVPQADGYPKPHNVIKGSFTGKGQMDWAILCSHKGESSILVFKGQTNKIVAQLSRGLDEDWLQGGGEGKIDFSHMISPANKTIILRCYREYGGPKPPPIDHQGIENSFVGKASVILYYHKGTWLRLTGAD
jgi:hypothetical protein